MASSSSHYSKVIRSTRIQVAIIPHHKPPIYNSELSRLKVTETSLQSAILLTVSADLIPRKKSFRLLRVPPCSKNCFDQLPLGALSTLRKAMIVSWILRSLHAPIHFRSRSRLLRIIWPRYQAADWLAGTCSRWAGGRKASHSIGCCSCMEIARCIGLHVSRASSAGGPASMTSKNLFHYEYRTEILK